MAIHLCSLHRAFIDRGRLFATAQMSTNDAWRPQTIGSGVTSEYLEVDMGSSFEVVGLVTRGSLKAVAYSHSVTVRYSDDRVTWTWVTDASGSTQVSDRRQRIHTGK